MNDMKKTKTVVLFKLSFVYLLLQLFLCFFSKGDDIVIMLAIVYLAFLVCALLPLVGLFAVNDYRKAISSPQAVVSFGQKIFYGILALNAPCLFAIFIAIFIPYSWQVSIPAWGIFHVFLVDNVLCLIVLLILLIKTRSKFFGYGLATSVVLAASSAALVYMVDTWY
jgi:hypothetical protein